MRIAFESNVASCLSTLTWLRRVLTTLCGLALFLLTGCATVHQPENRSIRRIDNQHGYRLFNTRQGDYGDHLVFLAFSGGGTRAAALAYGALTALRDTEIGGRGRRVRLLDEVDSISAVSGGSFTAAYYGLFGEKIFTEYERDFLRQSIQGALVAELFSPAFWWRTVFTQFDRTEMAIEFYDRQIFKGKRFSDIDLAHGPFIEINATELGRGNRFSFTQSHFDAICSDVGQYPVARAVTASSALPVIFSPVVLGNHAGECDTQSNRLVRYLNTQAALSPRLAELKKRISLYSDRKAMPYLHLVDGGISDNLGLRSLSDRIESIGSGFLFTRESQIPKDILIISIDAQVRPERGINQSPSKPSIVDTIDAFSNVQMGLYNRETRLLLDKQLEALQGKLRAKGYDVPVYVAEVSFESIRLKSLKSRLNSLPTSLELSGRDVDILIDTGRTLLRQQPGYRDFLTMNGLTRH